MTPGLQQRLRAAVRKERKGKKGPVKGGRKKVDKALESSPVKTPVKARRGRPKKVQDDKAPAPKSKVSPMKSRKKRSPEKEKKSYGCSRCRYAAKGCKTCKNPDFRPRGRRAAKTV